MIFVVTQAMTKEKGSAAIPDQNNKKKYGGCSRQQQKKRKKKGTDSRGVADAAGGHEHLLGFYFVGTKDQQATVHVLLTAGGFGPARQPTPDVAGGSVTTDGRIV